MEDYGVTETEKEKLHETERGKRDHEKEEGDEERPSGIINHIISNLVSGGREGGGGGDKEIDGAERGGKEKEEKEGGLITHLISNLVSPPLNEKKVESFEVKDESSNGDGSDSKSEEGAGGGRIINNLISNLLHRSEAKEGKEDKNNQNEKLKDVKTEEEGGGKGGIIDNLISQLPTSLADGVAPPTDEASILLHSIVHD
ncbi:hypothetical protein HYC85_022186 [Camellia sinensis]|uniref:Uncharacterized protein n=1 Tax=Camellia sinensis TaxID=4442 RepID=A0A7J7GJN3_CAMSI|nr:hypothetical protein HYC85_022186 [Camellia sinensis]